MSISDVTMWRGMEQSLLVFQPMDCAPPADVFFRGYYPFFYLEIVRVFAMALEGVLIAIPLVSNIFEVTSS